MTRDCCEAVLAQYPLKVELSTYGDRAETVYVVFIREGIVKCHQMSLLFSQNGLLSLTLLSPFARLYIRQLIRIEELSSVQLGTPLNASLGVSNQDLLDLVNRGGTGLPLSGITNMHSGNPKRKAVFRAIKYICGYKRNNNHPGSDDDDDDDDDMYPKGHHPPVPLSPDRKFSPPRNFPMPDSFYSPTLPLARESSLPPSGRKGFSTEGCISRTDSKSKSRKMFRPFSDILPRSSESRGLIPQDDNLSFRSKSGSLSPEFDYQPITGSEMSRRVDSQIMPQRRISTSGRAREFSPSEFEEDNGLMLLESPDDLSGQVGKGNVDSGNLHGEASVESSQSSSKFTSVSSKECPSVAYGSTSGILGNLFSRGERVMPPRVMRASRRRHTMPPGRPSEHMGDYDLRQSNSGVGMLRRLQSHLETRILHRFKQSAEFAVMDTKLLGFLANVEDPRLRKDVRFLSLHWPQIEAPLLIVTKNAEQTSYILQGISLVYARSHNRLPLVVLGNLISENYGR